MALILITVKDTEKGVDVCIEQEPTVEPFQKTFTPAQKMASTVLSNLRVELAKTGPKLAIVGADGTIN